MAYGIFLYLALGRKLNTALFGQQRYNDYVSLFSYNIMIKTIRIIFAKFNYFLWDGHIYL